MQPFLAYSFNSFDILIEDTSITVLGHYAIQADQKLNLYVARYDTDLNLQWYAIIADFRPNVAGFFNGYHPQRIKRHKNNYYITGYASYPTQFVEDFVVKTDLSGNKVWDKRYRYQGRNSAGYDLLVFNDTLFRPSGYLKQTVANVDSISWHFMYLDTTGTIIKDTAYPETENSYQIQSCILATDNTILLTGHFYQGGAKGLIWK